MENGNTVTLYHLSRRDGTSLFLHPFRKQGSILSISSSSELRGRYGAEPRVESLTQFRNDLYRKIEQDVRNWINERRFVPRFLIASGAFLIVYFFMSLVIRDPLPILDEIVAAAIAGGITFFFIGRRFEQSKTAADRRVMIRTKVDNAVFSEDPFVHELEKLLHTIEALPTDQIVTDNEEINTIAQNIRNAYPDESARAISHLRALFSESEYRRLEKQLKKGRLTGKTQELVDHGTLVPAAISLLYVLQSPS